MKRYFVSAAALSLAICTTALAAAKPVSVHSNEFVYTAMKDHAVTYLDRYDILKAGINTYSVLWGDSLISLNEEGKYVPWLAEQMEWNDDKTSVTMHIRKNVKFQDGTDLTARDVKATYDRFIDNDKLENNKWKGKLIGTDLIDEYTVILKLSSPMSSFESECAQTPIVPEWAVSEDMKEFFMKPVGSGPYKLVEFDPETADMKFEKNEDWWGLKEGQTTYVDTIRQVGIDNEDQGVGLLKNGQVQHITLDNASQGLVNAVKASGYTVDTYNKSKHIYIAFNFNDNSIWNDKNLREAFSLCMDRSKLCQETGDAVVAEWPCQRTDPGYLDSNGYEYNLEKAKKLVEESEYDGSPIYVKLADKKTWNTLVKCAKEAGFNLKEMQEDGKYDLVYDQKSDRAVELFHVYGNDELKIGYDNDVFQELLTKAEQETDVEKQEKLREQIYTYMYDNFAPSIPLFDKVGKNAYVTNLDGMTESDTFNDYRFVHYN